MGLPDIFHSVKERENTAALQLLPDVVQQLDALASDPHAMWTAALKGVFAGNLFDLGAAASSAMFASGQVRKTRCNIMCCARRCIAQASFHATLSRLKPRPWVVDDLDAAVAALADPTRYARHIVMLVDNAGSDVVLGMLPLARMLLESRPQCTVVLGANALPSINDVTAAELIAVLDRAAALLGEADPLAQARGCVTSCVKTHRFCTQAWSRKRLRVVSTGNGLPVIDLTRVSAELCAAAEGAQLLVLEGMGRAIETNLHARATCDLLKLGMVKHPEVADMLGGELLDCVCKFDDVARY